MKKKKKTGLGRGISALIPDIDGPKENEAFMMCPIGDIVPNKYQPRTVFDPEEMEKLKDSIAEQGVLQPLLVRNIDDSFELIAGERRLRAAREANLTHVPVFIKDLTDEQMLEVSIIENIQRENLNVLEEAEAYFRLIQEFNYTQEKVAQKIGKNRSTIANLLRLRGLPDVIKTSLTREEISMGHARALLGVTEPDTQLRLFDTVVRRQLSVRQTEQLVNQAKKNVLEKEKPGDPHEQTDIDRICLSLSRGIRSRVRIRKSGDAGRIEIQFKTQEEFDRLVQVLSTIR